MAEVKRTTIRVGTLIATLLIALTGAGCHPMDDLLSSIFGRSMRDQPSLDPYDNPQQPPEGSIPFAAGNFPSAPGVVQLGQPEAGEIPPPVQPIQVLQQAPEVMEIENPIEPSSASLERGAEVFQRVCMPCHGSGGEGDGPVTQAGVPSFSIVSEEAREYPDGYLYSIIRVGRGAMPPFGHQITNYDRWHVVNYVRELQGGTLDVAGSESPAQDSEDR